MSPDHPVATARSPRTRLAVTASGRTIEPLRQACADRAVVQQATVGALVEPAAVLCSSGVVLAWNDAAAHFFGWSTSDAIGSHLRDLVGDVAADAVEIAPLAPGKAMRRRASRRRRDGAPVVLEVSVGRIDDGDRLVVWRDLSAQLANERLLRRQADTDPLTGLLNRRGLERRVHEEHGRVTSVVAIDLDNFKAVNDVHGHEAGDVVLRSVAARIRGGVGPGALVARVGGDELVVIDLDGGTERRSAVVLAVVRAFDDPVTYRGVTIPVGASIGVRDLPPELDADLPTALADADLASGRAKAAGRGRVVHFVPALREARQELLRTVEEFRTAVRSGEIEPWFQPFVDLGTGTVVGAEALARWRHPRRGVLAPGEFLEAAGEAGLVGALDRLMMRRSIDAAGTARRRGFDGFVSFNLDLETLDRAYVQLLVETATAADVPLGSLMVELTETSIARIDATRLDLLAELRDLGIHLALDDFGTAQSALSNLVRIPAGVLKIDRSFVAGLDRRENRAVVVATHSLAQTLGVHVIAEGVETPTQAADLAAVGIRVAQGHLFSHAVPLDDLVDLHRRGLAAQAVPSSSWRTRVRRGARLVHRPPRDLVSAEMMHHTALGDRIGW